MSLVGSHVGDVSEGARPFQHEPDYLALSRMLLRYQNLILLTPVPDERIAVQLAPWQQKIQNELWATSSLHRTKWLRNVEYARTLLLRLEKTAQAIKVQRAKREAVNDLGEKRATIKRLRMRIEEIGREVETRPESAPLVKAADKRGETLYDVLIQIEARRPSQISRDNEHKSGSVEVVEAPQSLPSPNTREALLGSQVRRRQGTEPDSQDSDKATSSSYSFLRPGEKALNVSADEHERLAADMVDMAIQLKQQARKMQFSLLEDNEILSQVNKGLQLSETAMEAARKGINSLTRMSEEEGFFGRLKLYAIIFGLWMLSIMFVFVGPKLRF